MGNHAVHRDIGAGIVTRFEDHVIEVDLPALVKRHADFQIDRIPQSRVLDEILPPLRQLYANWKFTNFCAIYDDALCQSIPNDSGTSNREASRLAGADEAKFLERNMLAVGDGNSVLCDIPNGQTIHHT